MEGQWEVFCYEGRAVFYCKKSSARVLLKAVEAKGFSTLSGL